MPKAAVYENRFSAGWKNDVRSSGEFSPVQSKPVSDAMKKPTHCQLRRCVLPANAGH